MKRLLSVLFGVLFIAFSLSGYFYFTLKRVVPLQENQLARTMNFLDTDTTYYDIIFIGTSRTYVHIDPRIIDSLCGVNSICVTIDGGTITQDVAMLKKYFIHHKAPRLILLSLDYGSLFASSLPYNYPEYYPYLDDSIFNAVNSSAIYKFRYSFFYEKYDRFIKYSAKTDYQKFAALTTSIGIKHKYTDLGEEPAWYSKMKYYKGFSGIDLNWSARSDAELDTKLTVLMEQQGIDFLNDFINITIENGSKPVIIFSPMYYSTKKQFGETDNFFSKVNQTASGHSIPFWNYSNDSICYSKDNFYNIYHMNIRGAEKFSVILAKDINEYNSH